MRLPSRGRIASRLPLAIADLLGGGEFEGEGVPRGGNDADPVLLDELQSDVEDVAT